MGVSARFDLDLPELERQGGAILRRKHSQITHSILVLAEAKVPKRSLRLARSGGVDPQHMRGPLYVTGGVTFSAPYAEPVHEGARPHTIRARAGHFLEFLSRGRVIFDREVHHPGNRARPFLRDAMNAAVAADGDIG